MFSPAVFAPFQVFDPTVPAKITLTGLLNSLLVMVFCDDEVITIPWSPVPRYPARILFPVIVLPSLPWERIRPIPFDGVSVIRHRSTRLASVLSR